VHHPSVSEICRVVFADGWTVRLRALYCQATYVGDVEGPHTRMSNDRRIHSMSHRANKLFGETPVHVIAPARTTGPIIDGYLDQGQPVRRELLPPICCIGDFEADVVPGEDGCASGLVIIWFQAAPAPVPIEPDLVDMLGDVRWNELAASYWY
jgi:hypothetical protein